MSNLFAIEIKARLYTIVLLLLIIATTIITSVYFSTKDPVWAPIWGGLATGLIVAVIQLLLQFTEYRDIEKIKQLGITDILPYREGKEYYNKLIVSSRRKIHILGNTASRFLEDFAHPSRVDSRSLLDALERGVEVKLLLPLPKYLSEIDKAKYESAHARIIELNALNKAFGVRYFDHPPAHSLVVVDDTCLVGPIFPDIQSKDSPAIHAYSSSKFVALYLEHFDNEWQSAKDFD